MCSFYKFSKIAYRQEFEYLVTQSNQVGFKKSVLDSSRLFIRICKISNDSTKFQNICILWHLLTAP